MGADSPAFSLGGRYNSAGTRGQSPGPAYDPNFRFTSPRKRDPAYTFGVRPSSGRPQSATIPGPGAYDPSLRRGAPAFSLGARNDRDNKDATLGPTVVHEPHFGPPAGYTFGTRVRSLRHGGYRGAVSALASSCGGGVCLCSALSWSWHTDMVRQIPPSRATVIQKAADHMTRARRSQLIMY